MIKLYNINSIISNNTDNDVLENVSYTVKLKFNDNVINKIRNNINYRVFSNVWEYKYCGRNI